MAREKVLEAQKQFLADLQSKQSESNENDQLFAALAQSNQDIQLQLAAVAQSLTEINNILAIQAQTQPFLG